MRISLFVLWYSFLLLFSRRLVSSSYRFFLRLSHSDSEVSIHFLIGKTDFRFEIFHSVPYFWLPARWCCCADSCVSVSDHQIILSIATFCSNWKSSIPVHVENFLATIFFSCLILLSLLKFYLGEWGLESGTGLHAVCARTNPFCSFVISTSSFLTWSIQATLNIYRRIHISKDSWFMFQQYKVKRTRHSFYHSVSIKDFFGRFL